MKHRIDELKQYELEDWFINVFHETIETVLEEDFFSEQNIESDQVKIKCREAAEQAFVLNACKLQVERKQYPPMALFTFLKLLCDDIGFKIENVASLFKIDTIAFVPKQNLIVPIINFLNKIGVTAQDIMLNVRIEFAQSKGLNLQCLAPTRSRGIEDTNAIKSNIDQELCKLERFYSKSDSVLLSKIVDLI